MEGLKGISSSNPWVHGTHVIVFSSVLFFASGCNEQNRRAEANQLVLEQKIDANARRIALLASQYQKSQIRLSESINEVQRGNEVTLAEAIAARYEQRRMREDSLAYDQKWQAGMVRIADKQRRLQGSVAEVAGQAREIDRRVHLIGDAQVAQRREQASNQKQVTDRLRLMTENQQELYMKTLEGLTTSEGIAIEVAEVQLAQKRAQRVREIYNQRLVGQVSLLAAGQEKVQASVDRNHASGRRVAENVTTLQRGQSDLRSQIEQQAEAFKSDISQVTQAQERTGEAVDRDHKLLSGKLDSLTTRQQQAQLSLEEAHDTTARIARQTTSIGGQQASLHELVRRHQEDLLESNRQSAENQALMKVSLDEIHETTQDLSRASISLHTAVRSHDGRLTQGIDDAKQAHAKTFADVADVNRHQETLQESLDRIQEKIDLVLSRGQSQSARQQKSYDDLTGSHAGIVWRQQGLTESIATLNEAFARLAGKADDIMIQQGALSRMIQTKSAVMEEVATAVHRDQQRVGASLDNLKKNADQVLRDTVALREGQTRLIGDVREQRDQVQRNQTQLGERLASRDRTVSDALVGLESRQSEWQVLADSWSRKALTLGEKIGDLEGAFRALLSDLDRRLVEIANSLTSFEKEPPQAIAHIKEELRPLAKTIEYMKGIQKILTHEIEKVRTDAQDHRQEILNAVGELRKENAGNSTTIASEIQQE